MPEVCTVDESVLADPSNEGRRPIDYHLNGVAYLANWLEAQRLDRTPLFQESLDLCRYFAQEPKEREPGRELEASNALMLFGSVGAALSHLRDRTNAQMRKELTRFATESQAIIGNYYLFYISGRLAGRRWDIDFIPESRDPGEKRPDIRAGRAGRHVFVEVNAKQPTIEVASPEQLYRMVRDIVEEKKQKFADPAFHPGMIVADVSPAHFQINEPGTPPFLELRRDLARWLPDGGFVYRLYEDVAWKERLHNQGNVFAYAVDEFLAINRQRFGVAYFLLTAVRRAVRLSDGKIAYPRHHVLLADRAHWFDELLDLSHFVYLV